MNLTRAFTISIICLTQIAVISGSWMLETKRSIIENISKEKYPPKCIDVKGTYYKDDTCSEVDTKLTSTWRQIYTSSVLTAMEYCVPVTQHSSKTWKEGDHSHENY